MKITKTTVKTISTIILDSVDFACMIEDYKKSEYFKSAFPNAFKE